MRNDELMKRLIKVGRVFNAILMTVLVLGAAVNFATNKGGDGLACLAGAGLCAIAVACRTGRS